MSTLILLRHGQSMWNAHGRFTGWVDVPLSRDGIDEAIAAGDELADHSIDIVYMSGLMRAQQTAMIALAEYDDNRVPIVVHEDDALAAWSGIHDDEASRASIPCYVDQRLNERCYGDLQGLKKEAVAQEYGAEQCHVWRRSFDVPPPGGEDLKATAERVIPCLMDTIVPALMAGRNCLVAAHGNSLRAMVMAMEGLSQSEVLGLEIPTGQPRAYEYSDEGMFTLL